MAAIDGRTADRIAATLFDFGWRVTDRGRPHTYQVYPPGGGMPLVVGPGSGRDAANTFANLRRCGIEFDPKRRQVVKRTAAAATAGARPRSVPPVPIRPPASSPPPQRPLPAVLPGWAMALEFSPHAFDRLADRNVGEWEARACVAWPDYTRESRHAPGRLISVRGDIAVITERQRVVTVLDRHDDRIEPRSPAPPPTQASPTLVPNRAEETTMSTSQQIKDHIRLQRSEFTVSDVVDALKDNPVVSSGLVSQMLTQMLEQGEVRRIGRGRYAPTAEQPAAAPAALRPAPADEPKLPPAVRVRSNHPQTLVVDFEWAEIPPPERVSAAAQQKHLLAEGVQLHLDTLKQQPGRWATLATFPADVTKGVIADRARGLREAFPGLDTRVVDRTVYIAWTGE